MVLKNDAEKELLSLIGDLQVFIKLSFQEDESPLKDWLKETINNLEGSCYIIKHCDEKNCPAYKNECGRCWLIAGTMCGGMPRGKHIEKYEFCTECEIFQGIIGDDPVRKLRELVIILIHSLRTKHEELKEALSNIKVLKGLLPICATCKKIRDDKGSWNQLEFFIDTHSEAQLSHGMCPECAKEHFPQYYERIKAKRKDLKKEKKNSQ